MALTGASRLAPLPLRLAVGATCLFYGYQHVFHGPTFDALVTHVNTLGLPNPEILAHVAAWGGLAGGVMLIVGFGTRLAALVNAATLGVLLWMVKLGGADTAVERLRNDFPAPDGYMPWLVLFLACISLVLTGGGALSLDSMLAMKRSSRAVTVTD